MPRRRDKVVIEREGRDHGKIFWITEMSASAGEYWAGRLLTMLAAGNADVPPGFFQLGFEGCAAWVAVHGIGGIDWAVCKPLLDEMMACVTIQPDAARNVTRELLEDDIEEIVTRTDTAGGMVRHPSGFFRSRAGTGPRRRIRRRGATRLGRISQPWIGRDRGGDLGASTPRCMNSIPSMAWPISTGWPR